ncbi:MAG TPA: phosphopantetheine-binding protein [Candidatus Angelobacter sp.]|nr:phosphopantetheine-binding protein [Candidatus Angelobacter sp.]
MPQEITEKVLDLIASTKRVPREKVTIDSTFEELAMDSLDGLNLMFEIEGEFNISVPDEEARAIKTARELVEKLEKLLQKSASEAKA